MLNKFLPTICLGASGLLITVVSAFFSVQGFLLFLPDPHLFYGILGLGIAFELAKITGSTFLFHRMKDGNFPVVFKLLMTVSMFALIIFSSIFSFVHLNSSASQSLVGTNLNGVKIEQLQSRNTTIQETISGFETQINSMSKDMVTARIKLYDKFKPEKEKLQAELAKNIEEINTLQINTVENDQFTFLTNLSQFTGFEREKIFTIVIMFIVIIIDPLAISLFLSASHILAEEKKIEIKEEILEEIDTNNDGLISEDEVNEFASLNVRKIKIPLKKVTTTAKP